MFFQNIIPKLWYIPGIYRNICKAQKKYAEPRRVVSGYIAITWKPSREVRGSRVHPASHIHPASCGPQPPRTTTSHGEVRGKEKAQKASQFVSVARKKTLSGRRKLNRFHLSVIVWYIANICKVRKKYAEPQRVASQGWCACERESSKGFSVGRGRSEEKFLRFGDCVARKAQSDSSRQIDH